MSKQAQIAIGSVLAGLQVINGAVILADAIGETAAGVIALVIGAIQVGWQSYVSQTNTPNAQVVAALPEPDSAGPVAGPASPSPNGTPVVVTASTTEGHL